MLDSLQYAFVAFVLVAALLAASQWRWGIHLLIVAAILQDPIRKVTLGTPAYLVMATVPIWVGMAIGAWRQRELTLTGLAGAGRALSGTLRLYLAMLVVPAILSATYGPGSWQYTLLGAYTQAGVILGIMLGFAYPRRAGDLERLLKVYCLVTAVALVGAPLELFGVGTSAGLTGTRTMGAYWVTYRMGDALHMISGFYRSPDILGWHAATLVMFAMALALKEGGWRRIGWTVLAGWGGVALMLCARRKMVAMIPVYSVAMIGFLWMLGSGRRTLALVATLAAAATVGGYAYLNLGADDDTVRFYATTVDSLGDSIQAQGVDAVRGTVEQSGFFGYGLGMAVQGVHHIDAPRPRIWQESGLSILLAEVGIPGTLAFVLVAVAAFWTVWRAVGNVRASPELPIYCGLASVLIANGLAGIVSAQIFGDPFIGCFLPFMAGLAMAGLRHRQVSSDVASGSTPEVRDTTEGEPAGG